MDGWRKKCTLGKGGNAGENGGKTVVFVPETTLCGQYAAEKQAALKVDFPYKLRSFSLQAQMESWCIFKDIRT